MNRVIFILFVIFLTSCTSTKLTEKVSDRADSNSSRVFEGKITNISLVNKTNNHSYNKLAKYIPVINTKRYNQIIASPLSFVGISLGLPNNNNTIQVRFEVVTSNNKILSFTQDSRKSFDVGDEVYLIYSKNKIKISRKM